MCRYYNQTTSYLHSKHQVRCITFWNIPFRFDSVAFLYLLNATQNADLSVFFWFWHCTLNIHGILQTEFSLVKKWSEPGKIPFTSCIFYVSNEQFQNGFPRAVFPRTVFYQFLRFLIERQSVMHRNNSRHKLLTFISKISTQTINFLLKIECEMLNYLRNELGWDAQIAWGYSKIFQSIKIY